MKTWAILFLGDSIQILDKFKLPLHETHSYQIEFFVVQAR